MEAEKKNIEPDRIRGQRAAMNASAYAQARAYAKLRGAGEAGGALYKHGNIAIYSGTIKLGGYYMPTGAAKVIRFSEVEAVEEVAHSFWTTKGWGAGADCKTWWHWDWCLRGLSSRRTRGIILRLRHGCLFDAGLSPRTRDYATVLGLIRERVADAHRQLAHSPGCGRRDRPTRGETAPSPPALASIPEECGQEDAGGDPVGGGERPSAARLLYPSSHHDHCRTRLLLLRDRCR